MTTLEATRTLLRRDARVRWVIASGAAALAWAVAAIALPEGAPPGLVAIGASLGAASALTAVGLVLVWRSARIVNFAVGAMGAATGLSAIRLSTAWGWNYSISLVVGTMCGLVVGVLVDALVIRRFTNASRLVTTVATIGLAQLLGGVELTLPGAIFGTRTGPTTVGGFETPLSRLRITIGAHVIDGNHLLICAVVPIVVVALHLFLQRTRVGIATRASAENRQWARLLGIPVARLSMVTWGAAGGLAALTFLLKAPFVGTVPQAAVGPGALLVPLAAALVARMESMSVAVAAAVGLGVVDQVVRWNARHTPGLSDLVILIVILVVLMSRRRDTSRARDADTQLQIVPRARVAWLPEGGVPSWAVKAVGAVVVLGTIVIVPLLVDDSTAYTLSIASIWAIVAVSTVVVTGWTGQLSLGQFAVVGIAAAVAGNLLSRLHLDLFVAVGAALATGMVVAALLGIPALRIRGPFLGIATLAFAVVVDGYVLNPNYFPDLIPENVPRPELLSRWSLEREQTMLVVCLVGLVLVVVAAASLRATRSGRNLLATRDNPKATEAMSVSSKLSAVKGFVVSGAMAGLAGALHVMVLHGVRVGTFRPSASIDSFSTTTIGGLTSLPGAVGSGLVVRAAQDSLSSEVRLVSMGIGVLIVLWLVPSGLASVPSSVMAAWARRRGGAATDDGGSLEMVEVPVTTRVSGTPAAISTEGVEVSFGRLKVLFGVDIAVDEGEILALLGTNGAGKSTWLKAVMGLVPSSGTITLDGVDASEWPTERIVRRGVALMVGGQSTFPTMTVAEHLGLAGWTRWSERGALAAHREELLEVFPSLRRRLDTMAGDLSGGEQQQLALAQTLLLRPRVLLIDELSLGLAPIVVESLLEVVEQLHAEGTTVVVVEQSVNLAITLAERAVFMEKGEVRYVGPTAELLERPEIMHSIFFESAEVEVGPSAGASAEADASADASRAVLECSGVTKRFGGVLAVIDAGLSIRPGEIVGLIGQNGAGKSTLLDCLSGFYELDGGTIRLDGTEVGEWAPWERAFAGLGRSFQEARLFPGLTVSETIAVARERHVVNRSMFADVTRQPRSWASEADTAEHVERLVGELGLVEYADTLTSSLSTGTRRVVELACLLAAEPKVLLLDEPSAGVAQRETEALGPLLVKVRDMTGAAVVVVEHDMALLRSICDRMVALDLGATIAEGTPAEVLANPAVTAAYLGNNTAVIERSGSGGGAGIGVPDPSTAVIVVG